MSTGTGKRPGSNPLNGVTTKGETAKLIAATVTRMAHRRSVSVRLEGSMAFM